jgi:sugar phosphate isomerase/epimerase
MDWHPRLSVNEECVGFKVPFVDELGLWTELGVDNVGVISPKLEQIGWDAELAQSTGLTISNIGTEERCLMEALEFGAAVGTDSVWITPGPVGGRSWEEAAADFCERVRPAVLRADELGIDFALEPTNSLRFDISFVFTLRDSVELARAAGTKVVVELCCCWYERGLEQLVRDNLDLWTLVQIADMRSGVTSTPNRAVIGDGDIPLERLLALFLDAGYEGLFDLEILGPEIEAEGHVAATRRSLERASELLERLGA